MKGEIQGFGHRIFARSVGGMLVFALDKKFINEVQIKHADYVVPCLISNSKMKEEDPVLGLNELIFRFRRNREGKNFEILNLSESNDYENIG